MWQVGLGTGSEADEHPQPRDFHFCERLFEIKARRPDFSARQSCV